MRNINFLLEMAKMISSQFKVLEMALEMTMA